jgi:RNA polymerase sigma-70 factor (ECF subfamily)
LSDRPFDGGLSARPSDEQARVTAEREAVAACLAGRIEAFELLVREHSQRIIRLSYHFLGDWDEARDLAQETLVRAFHCLERYDPDRPLGTWLCTIAARLATDRLRRRKTQARAEESLRASARRAADPETSLTLREALDQLTPRQRQAVVLCDLHGFTAPEAAAIIGCSASTIRVQRFLARSRMKAFLGAVITAATEPRVAGLEEAE